MTCSPRFWELFFEVYEVLPRQGPGNRACMARALAWCRDLPARAMIADLGCGSGGQTLHLAARCEGNITALDTHAPSIARLSETIDEQGLADRVRAMVGDMSAPPFTPDSLDLIWCEGALYQIGIENGLRLWRPLLRDHGHIAFSECVWLREDPPVELQANWAEEYPAMAGIAENLAIIDRCGFDVLGHFTLPDEAWWDDFYTPMERRIRELTLAHAGDDEALVILARLQREVDLHRVYAGWYGYEFFVIRRTE